MCYDDGMTEIIRVRSAGDDHQVVTVEGGTGRYRRQPCGGCPWRTDQAGQFPPEAFIHSAETAYDMADRGFACHESGADRPATCAGFLLRGAAHNLAIRLRISSGDIDPAQVGNGGHELYPNYRAMAVANGVDPNHPRLRPCRNGGYE